MEQSKKIKATKSKLVPLVAMTAIITSCATNNHHKKVALKIVKNNEAILEQIKKERSQEEFTPLIQKSPKLIEAEKRLLMALAAVIESNKQLKKEFINKPKKEVQIEQKQ